MDGNFKHFCQRGTVFINYRAHILMNGQPELTYETLSCCDKIQLHLGKLLPKFTVLGPTWDKTND